jgi:hypothetical protein
MNRRDFSLSLAAGSFLASSGMAAWAGTRQTLLLPHLQKQAFAACLNQPFTIRGTSSQTQFNAQLSSVDDAGKGEQFFVRFSGEQGVELTEDIYTLTATDGQEMLLHMQPSVSDPDTLEAVINLHTV